jgi:tRNA(fMet)-specific endonuclease VapC
MTKYLFDTGILSAYIDRRRGVFEHACAKTADGHRIGTCVPVVAEMAAGLQRSSARDRNLKALRLALPTLKVWPLDQDAAFEFGRIHAELLRLGRPMQTIDIMIAAIAMTLGNCTVVSTDSDLTAVPGLTVENWAR